MGDNAGTRAVVLGGSLAGLFATKVLADAYDEVIVIDRDELIGAKGPRRRCPQGRHINGLLPGGHKAVETLFPGITEELFASGVPGGDLSGTVRWFFNGKRLKPQHGGLQCVGATRPLLEYHVRERVQALPNVTFLENHDILGLHATADGSRVTGARVQRTGSDDPETIIRGDLVVDATGRGSRAPAWLESLGYPRVEEERKKVDLVYVTQHYRIRPGADPYQGDLSINPVASPDLPRGAVCALAEDNQIELTTYGLLGDHPPTDQDGFYEWIKSLSVPDVYEAIQQADPLHEPIAFRFPTTLRRHYQKMERFPDGFVITGDAVTSFNPVYAQGMTVAALSALTLRQHLHSGADPSPLDYFRDLARDVVDQPWEMTNIVDLGFKGVVGKRTLQVRLAQKFLRLVQEAATRSGAVTAAYMRSASLLGGTDELKKPGMLVRVLWHGLRARFEKPAPRRPISVADSGSARKAA